jgi:hypothetical protein
MNTCQNFPITNGTHRIKLSIRTSLLCCASTCIVLAKVTSRSFGYSSNKLSAVSGNLRKLQIFHYDNPCVLTYCSNKEEKGGGDEYMSKLPHYQCNPYQNSPTFSHSKSSFDQNAPYIYYIILWIKRFYIYSRDSLLSSKYKTDRHDITELLLKVYLTSDDNELQLVFIRSADDYV